MKKSWRTTTAALLGIVSMIALAVKAMIDGDPSTSPQLEVVIPAVIGQIGLIFARDNVVSSEQAGAVPSKE